MKKNEMNCFIEPWIAPEVYDIIRKRFITGDPLLDNILSGVFSNHGKCVRPHFMKLVTESAGGKWENVKNAAAVIEGIHVSSLVHDDILDSSELRRGEQTLNAKFSNKISVLFGDFTFIRALNHAHAELPDRAISIIYRAVERMIQGEIIDAFDFRTMTENVYLKMVGNKTGALFAASGELGMVLAGENGQKSKLAGELGEYLGISFQIIDDALDFNGEEEIMGKPCLKDAISGYITLPLIYSIKDMETDEVSGLFDGNEKRAAEIYELVRSKGGIEYSLEKAGSYMEKARAILDNLIGDANPDLRNKFDNFFDILLKRSF